MKQRYIPIHGTLQYWLNKNLLHSPDDDINIICGNKSLRCAIHQWINCDAQVKKDVLVCSYCRIGLCVWSHQKFHTQSDVKKLRNHVESIMMDGGT